MSHEHSGRALRMTTLTLSTGRLRPALRAALPPRAAGFVAALAERFAWRSSRDRFAEMIFRRLPAPPVSQWTHWHGALHLSPQILLHLNASPRLLPTGSDRERRVEVHTERLRLTLREKQSLQTIVERRLAREIHREPEPATIVHAAAPSRTLATRASRPAADFSENAPPAREVPRIFRRNTAPAPEPSSTVTEPPSRRPAPEGSPPSWAEARAPSPHRPPSLSPAEIHRLTDQVVAAIDRRVIAHRERRGLT